MKIKAAFFDIDNTLYDWKNREWTPSGIEAVKAIKKKGIKVFVCSARPYQSIQEFGVFDMGIKWDGYVASAGGIAFAKGKYLLKVLMEPSETYRLIKVAKANHLTMEIVTPKTRYLIAPRNEFLTNYYGTYSDSTPPVKRYRGGEVTGALLFAPEKFDSLFREEFPDFIFYRFHETGVDVSSGPHLKGNGIQAILDAYGFTKEEAISFGDDMQDIPMKSASFFVCMGNGREEVKQAADMVTDEIWNDGVKNALVKLGLL